METTIRWSRVDTVAVLCTADPIEARRWTRKGYAVRVLGKYPGGEPRTWETMIPRKAVSLRSLIGGELPKRGVRSKLRQELGDLDDEIRRLEEANREAEVGTWQDPQHL